MPVCAVPTCTTTHRTTDKTLYRLPKDVNYARIWARCCLKKNSFNTKYAFICSLHFAEEAYQRDINHDVLGFSSRKSLRKDAVPTLQLPQYSLFCNSILEAHKTVDDSLLVDIMPAISPKSFLKPKIQFDFFSSPRKIKCRSKFNQTFIKGSSESKSLDQSTDTSFDLSTENVKYLSEENENHKVLSEFNSKNQEEFD